MSINTSGALAHLRRLSHYLLGLEGDSATYPETQAGANSQSAHALLQYYNSLPSEIQDDQAVLDYLFEVLDRFRAWLRGHGPSLLSPEGTGFVRVQQLSEGHPGRPGVEGSARSSWERPGLDAQRRATVGRPRLGQGLLVQQADDLRRALSNVHHVRRFDTARDYIWMANHHFIDVELVPKNITDRAFGPAGVTSGGADIIGTLATRNPPLWLQDRGRGLIRRQDEIYSWGWTWSSNLAHSNEPLHSFHDAAVALPGRNVTLPEDERYFNGFLLRVPFDSWVDQVTMYTPNAMIWSRPSLAGGEAAYLASGRSLEDAAYDGLNAPFLNDGPLALANISLYSSRLPLRPRPPVDEDSFPRPRLGIDYPSRPMDWFGPLAHEWSLYRQDLVFVPTRDADFDASRFGWGFEDEAYLDLFDQFEEAGDDIEDAMVRRRLFHRTLPLYLSRWRGDEGYIGSPRFARGSFGGVDGAWRPAMSLEPSNMVTRSKRSSNALIGRAPHYPIHANNTAVWPIVPSNAHDLATSEVAVGVGVSPSVKAHGWPGGGQQPSWNLVYTSDMAGERHRPGTAVQPGRDPLGAWNSLLRWSRRSGDLSRALAQDWKIRRRPDSKPTVVYTTIVYQKYLLRVGLEAYLASLAKTDWLEGGMDFPDVTTKYQVIMGGPATTTPTQGFAAQNECIIQLTHTWSPSALASAGHPLHLLLSNLSSATGTLQPNRHQASSGGASTVTEGRFLALAPALLPFEWELQPLMMSAPGGMRQIVMSARFDAASMILENTQHGYAFDRAMVELDESFTHEDATQLATLHLSVSEYSHTARTGTTGSSGVPPILEWSAVTTGADDARLIYLAFKRHFEEVKRTYEAGEWRVDPAMVLADSIHWSVPRAFDSATSAARQVEQGVVDSTGRFHLVDPEMLDQPRIHNAHSPRNMAALLLQALRLNSEGNPI